LYPPFLPGGEYLIRTFLGSCEENCLSIEGRNADLDLTIYDPDRISRDIDESRKGGDFPAAHVETSPVPGANDLIPF
jgi:hypothetical protein